MSHSELGRGTSTFDGMAVAMAVLYYLASQSRSLTLFATHYSSLTTDFSHHPNIKNMHMSSVLDDEKREVRYPMIAIDGKNLTPFQLVFLYKLVSGAAPSSFGTHVASLAGVSPQVVQRAQTISDDFAAKFLAIQSSRMARVLPLVSQADFAFLRQCASGIREDSTCRSERIQIARASLRNYIFK
jgi:DNA mismatch repair protein MSH6